MESLVKQGDHMTKNMRMVVAIVIAVIILAGTIIIQTRQAKAPKENDSGEKINCTMDAKVCPDGSSVGRSGPDCEFEPCPDMVPAKP